MDKALINKWLNNSSMLGEQETLMLQELVDIYPYSQSIRLLYLKGLLNIGSDSFSEELKKTALYISDRKILFNLLEDREKQQSRLEEHHIVPADELNSDTHPATAKEQHDDRTADVINSFLSTLPEENLDYTTLEASSDYMGYLFEDSSISSESEVKQNPFNGQNLIDDFLNKSTKKTPNRPDVSVIIESDVSSEKKEEEGVNHRSTGKENTEREVAETEDDGFLTETLAKIYIKQKRYSKALEILKKISLKYPNKNAYFADQIRFLEKLIINAKSK